MKFDPENVKKVFLSALLFAGLIYVYFALLLGPLAKAEKRAVADIAALRPEIAAANTQLKKTDALKRQAPVAQQTYDQIAALSPAGAPVAWFPPRMVDFFKRHGINRCSVRLNSDIAEKDLPNFHRTSWAIDLPKVEANQLAVAIMGLENEEPLVEVTNFVLEAGKDDAQYQRALLTVNAIVKQ